ncbi:MAG TPA: hypothetical protein VGJ58_08805 [Gaiellaceae bacterium]|jgi:hypothetical protein
MTIVNRRYAVLGWATWQVAKAVGKKKARAAVPGSGDHAGLNKSAIASIAALIAAVVGGAVWFWRKKSDQAPATTSAQGAVTSE